MKRTLLSLALMAAGLAGTALPVYAAQPAQVVSMVTVGATVPDPAAQLEETARLFRAGDVTALAKALMPPSKWQELKLQYEVHRLEPTSADDRAHFAEGIAKFTAPDAVDRFMEEIEPKLAEARPQVGGALLMGFGAMQMAVTSPDSELTDEQRAALQSAMPGIQKWASTTDFLSSDTMRTALTLLTDAARRTGITDIDQIKAMPLESVLQRAGTVLAAGKEAVRLYGIDLDAVADSLRVDVLEIDGDKARVRTTVTLFDAPLWAEHDLVLVEGRWYGKDALIEFGKHHARHVNHHDHEDAES
jgi:hypothetical protein